MATDLSKYPIENEEEKQYVADLINQYYFAVDEDKYSFMQTTNTKTSDFKEVYDGIICGILSLKSDNELILEMINQGPYKPDYIKTIGHYPDASHLLEGCNVYQHNIFEHICCLRSYMYDKFCDSSGSYDAYTTFICEYNDFKPCWDYCKYIDGQESLNKLIDMINNVPSVKNALKEYNTKEAC